MNVDDIIQTLLEDDPPLDPKEIASEIPSSLQSAIDSAMDEFIKRCENGSISGARDSDEQASEIAQDACIKFNLDEDDFDQVVSELFMKASEIFPGQE